MVYSVPDMKLNDILFGCAVATADTNGEPLELELPFHTDWVDLWCPHLAHAIVSGSANRRKHISTRCLPLLVDIVGGSARRQDATYAFSFLLEEVRLQRDQLCRIGEQVESYAGETESLSDRLLWASLEVSMACFCSLHGFLSLTSIIDDRRLQSMHRYRSS